MKAVEATIRLDGGISVKLGSTFAGSAGQLTFRKPSGDQRESDYQFYCTLDQWEGLVDAVTTLRKMVSEDEQADAD